MSRIGANRFAQVNYELHETVKEVRKQEAVLESKLSSWQRIGEIARTDPENAFCAAQEVEAKEDVREASLATVESKMRQGELEDELFATGEDADDWYSKHQ